VIVTLDTFADFRARLAHLASFHCPAAHGDPGTDAVHTAEHPTRASCAEAIVFELHHLDYQLRRRAWRDRSEVNALSTEIWQAQNALCAELDVVPPPCWSLADVIAGGPGRGTRRPGYSR
jgi:hypothetical protein